jgi:hypothetical protein
VKKISAKFRFLPYWSVEVRVAGYSLARPEVTRPARANREARMIVDIKFNNKSILNPSTWI